MHKITVALTFEDNAQTLSFVESLAASDLVAQVLLIAREEHKIALEITKTRIVQSDLFSGRAITELLETITTDYLLLILPGEQVELGSRAIERFCAVAEDSNAGLIYSDFKDEFGASLSDHPLIDYQQGSIRDSFDFGSMLFMSKRAAAHATSKHGAIDDRLQWAGLYDLRLKLSIDSEILRIPEPLYARIPRDLRVSGERQFDYVDPKKRDYQREMEEVATEHLKRIGAYLEPRFKQLQRVEASFPVRASVVIPVRNRERTIQEAASSALSQKTSFDFNVIVVDNHSSDKTTEILAELAREHTRLVHLRPERTDLGIGGCWNEAIYSAHCGEYAVQLDSDDLYRDERTLELVLAKFEEGQYAMVIGSYTIVNFDLQEMPPGLIDHREWTRENGRNNALRINGLGAPRAFYVPVLREVGLP
ncbi:MAG TPA: glycosyltransferase family A protein, partial [Blastocatellia bacterium]|nr:glycosyltransferase family A protein [Blastocatellia bacterium]